MPHTYQCQHCQRTYSSSSHLRRHEKSHSGLRTFSCAFCHRHFGRRDIAHRHAKSCPEKRTTSEVSRGTPGRRKKACVACALARSACDQNVPCGRCFTKGVVCSYRRGVDIAPSLTVRTPSRRPAESLVLKLVTHGHLRCQSSFRSIKIPMPFLLNFTSPSTDSISARYQRCLSFAEDNQQSSAEPVSVSANHVGGCIQDVSTAQTWLEDETTGWLSDQFLLGDVDELWWDDVLGSNVSSQSEVVEPSGLEARMQQLLVELKALTNCSTGQDRVPPAFDEMAAARLFSSHNLLEFSNVYFDYWSSHCPILHRPTFDLTKIHLPLLLAVFLIGESYSTESYCSRGQCFYDLAEEYAFSHPCFRNFSMQDQPTTDCASSELEPLQAAYLMVLLQMSGNNILARRRVRDQRYHGIIVAARRLRLFDSRNEYLHREWVNTTGFDWEKFALRESRIRLAYLIFGIECNFSMFHSTYPRIPISEMTGDPMCSESCFSATTCAECERYARMELRSRSLSISACVNALLQSAVPISVKSGLEDLFPMSFFFVLCGMHCVINAARANNIGSSMGSVFLKALEQWIAIWKIQLDNVSAEESSKLGFMKDAGVEFWQLATIFVQAEALGMFDSDELRSMSAESMEGVSCLLEVFYLADTNTSRRYISGKVLEALD